MRTLTLLILALSFAPAEARQDAESRRLYVAAPGIRNYLEWGGTGVLIYDIDRGHAFVKRIPVSYLDEKDPEVDTLSELWPSANWYEREIWDMYGIRFKGHPNLKRILMYEEFQGHALRKDYPFNKRQPLIGPQS